MYLIFIVIILTIFVIRFCYKRKRQIFRELHQNIYNYHNQDQASKLKFKDVQDKLKKQNELENILKLAEENEKLRHAAGLAGIQFNTWAGGVENTG